MQLAEMLALLTAWATEAEQRWYEAQRKKAA